MIAIPEPRDQKLQTAELQVCADEVHSSTPLPSEHRPLNQGQVARTSLVFHVQDPADQLSRAHYQG